ncbi:uncharacterized protein LAESUDRAFT_721985 [Laetiporus sulphureus 93-53]|uniref:RING-type domain-containing protein n=1 Tax=Laetiporus sulphureus 93-53 TaxID=1314785 RepID=A0A165G4U9_9APHY|nr:uncharacterized protein LAESUDRAFT_721985 [Laetiporus sulphureus 93-53]KZT09831.1 hypothetical protein LAESUDRAFT_721985 [Laetiporus sulphureus 93-53]
MSLAPPPPSTHRRPTASGRQRENRLQPTASSTLTRRRKSRSPDLRIPEELPLARNDPGSRKKKRPLVASSSSAPNDLVTHADDAGSERERKPRSKHRPLSMLVEGSETILRLCGNSGSSSSRGKRKERSKSRDTQHRLSLRLPSPEPMELDNPPEDPCDDSEHSRLKQEIEHLKKQLALSKRAQHKLSKENSDLKKELVNSVKIHKDHVKEAERLQTQHKKSEELVSNIETNLTCQICMDLLSRPHGLSPCGHVLCQRCLQEWFRSAPTGDDDMHDDNDPESLLYRRKTCPCCRTAVEGRPIPLFLVKSITSVLGEARTPPGAPRLPTPPPEDDPWAGIFFHPDAFAQFEDFFESDEEEEDQEDYDDDDDDDDDWSADGYGTQEDEEQYEGRYVQPRWAPPRSSARDEDVEYMDHLSDDDLAMLRRGATPQMIELFAMGYTHAAGLTAVLEETGTTVYLGWNIRLHTGDESGEIFMDWISADMYERPERWNIIVNPRGNVSAYKLVPEGEDEEYDTSESEVWAAMADRSASDDEW